MGKQMNEDDTASFINDFFVNIGPSLATKCKSDWKFREANVEQRVDNLVTNDQKITKLCEDININKASCTAHLSR